jgi:ABC-type dipeptide/oligopeptide/nickel transport system permease subunit
LLQQGKDYLLEAPWILFWGATPLALTLLSFHLLSREEPQ